MALTECINEGQWLNGLLGEANKHMECFVEQPIAIKEDNMSTIAMTKQANNHSRTKHIDIKYHYNREMVEMKKVELTYCPSKLMIADIMTKPLNGEQFEKLRYDLGLE
jgi:hypothetical protein